MSQNFKSKQEIQDYGVEVANSNQNVLFEWATGLGKSLAAIRVMEAYGGRWNIVIAETNHESNWREQFKEHGKEHLLTNVNFFCYQSMSKYIENANFIFDEGHHILSELRLSHLTDIVTCQVGKRNVFLSATMTWFQKSVITSIIPNLVVFKVTLSQAIKWGLLPKPSVYLIPVQLDDTIKNQVFEYSKSNHVRCTEAGAYKLISSRVELYKQKYYDTRQHWDKIRWLRAGGIRKQFLADCKTTHAKILLEKLQDKRLICFAGSIPQAEELSGGNAIHSKVPKKQREVMIANFNNEESHKLFVVDMLKEGMNLKHIEAGINVQLDNVERYFTQTHGRVLRSQFPEQYILYVEDTQDEVYITTALENFDLTYVKKINLDEI